MIECRYLQFSFDGNVTISMGPPGIKTMTNKLSLRPHEWRALMESPTTLQILIDHYHQQEAEADAIGEALDCLKYMETRRKELEALRDKWLVANGDQPGDITIERPWL